MSGHYDRSALDALPDGDAPFPWRRAAWLTAGALMAALLLAGVLREVLGPPGRGPELVSPLNVDVETAAVFVGAFAGMLAAALVWRGWRHERDGDDPPGPVELVYGIVLAVALCLASAAWCARSLVCALAFAGLHPAPVAAAFTVTGTGEDDEEDGDGAVWLRLRAREGGREFRYRVDPAVVAAAHAGDTVALPVETGRWQVRRTLPGPELTIADLHRS